jgi:hypothetical protein
LPWPTEVSCERPTSACESEIDQVPDTVSLTVTSVEDDDISFNILVDEDVE